MALTETASVLLLMKGDVKDLRDKLKSVAADEREVVKAQIEAAEARNKSLDKWAAGLVKINSVIGTVSTAVKFGIDAFKTLDDQQNLAAGSAAYSLDGLRKASLGLKTDTELMRLGVAASTTTFKLNQTQLENVLKAQIAWEDQGKDGAKVAAALEDAIVKGNIKPLKELGVNLEMAKGKGEQFSQVQKVIAEMAKEGAKHQLDSNDAFEQAGVAWQNAMTKLKMSIGEVVVSMGPLISAMAQLLSKAADLVNMLGSAASDEFGKFSSEGSWTNDLGLSGTRITGGMGRAGNMGFGESANEVLPGIIARMVREQRQEAYNASFVGKTRDVAGGSMLADYLPSFDDLGALAKAAADKPKIDKAAVAAAKRSTDFAISYQREVIDDLYERLLKESKGSGPRTADGTYAAVNSSGAVSGLNELAAAFADVGAANAQKKSLLEGVFGKFDEYDAYSEKMSMLADAVGTFSGALQGSFDAWASGSATAKEALESLWKSTLSGIASSMWGRAIEHGAAAIGALAWGNIPAATIHAKAAAMNAAGAVALGAVSRAASGGASAGAGSGASAPNVTRSSAGNSSGPTVNNWYVGDMAAPDNMRQRRGQAERAYRMGRRAAGAESEIVSWG